MDPIASDLRPASERAREAGLTQIDATVGLVQYTRDLWQRRFFIGAFARARVQSANANQRLGQFWLVLNPLLNAAVFFFVFGVLFGARKGIPNYVAFLITGVFLFNYLSRTITAGSSSIAGNVGLMRALHFPRAVLPLSSTFEQLLQLGFSLIVLAAVIIVTGEPITFMWLLFPVGLGLQSLFAGGMALIVARLTSSIKDLGQLLPFLLRTWLYLSGVFYNVTTFGKNWPPVARAFLELQPGTVYLEVARDTLLKSYTAPPWAWPMCILWAVLASTIGYVYFWRGEKDYGRD